MQESSPENDATSTNFEDTELTLRLPGHGCRPSPLAENTTATNRAFTEVFDIMLTLAGHENLINHSVAKRLVASTTIEVVGWPPVRSQRKYVKVAVDGAPYLRKVNLQMYGGYEELIVALMDLFSCFTSFNLSNESKLVDLKGVEYVPIYEDKDSDWMVIGDEPWKMFIDLCKRIRLMRRSHAMSVGLLNY